MYFQKDIDKLWELLMKQIAIGEIKTSTVKIVAVELVKLEITERRIFIRLEKIHRMIEKSKG